MKKFGYFCLGLLPFIIVIGVQLFATYFAVFLGYLFPVNIATLIHDENFNAIIFIMYSLFTITGFGIWYYCCCGWDVFPKFKKTFPPLQILALFVLLPGLQYLCGMIAGIISSIFPKLMEQYTKLLENAGLDHDISVLLLIYSVILAPICEELVFRGVTLRYFRRALPFWLANIFQAILFGAFHMNWIQGIYAAALGLFLGYLCEKGGSIYFSIFMHFLFNLWGTVLSNYLPTSESPIYVMIVLILMVASPVGGLLLFIFGGKKKAIKLS